MTPIWLDTDIGSDIDDALALAYLLTDPEVELVGISTVTEVDERRARLCSALCRIANADVPIVTGARLPLLVAPRQTEVPQAHALDRWQHDEGFAGFEALRALSVAARRRPGEITLLAIGPMTNVALAFAVDPELPGLLKEVALMIGAFDRQYAEWNALNDPHAAQIVFRSAARRLRVFGLDVTTQVTMDKDEVVRRLQATEMGRCVADMAGAWKSNRITFHDPLAAVCLVHDVVGYRRGAVSVELASPRLGGFTFFDANPDGPHEIGATVDADAFFARYFDVLERYARA